MNAPIISVKNLTKEFNGTTAVDHISFDISEGITGLLGPNGAGKSTTIHMILGLIIPTAGSVEIFGLPFEKNREKILSKVNFSASYVYMPHILSVMENLKVFAKLYGVPSSHDKIAHLVDLFQLKPFLKKRTGTLSSGETSRLNLAKAFLNDPQLLLLDEPTASLDPDFADQVHQILLELHRSRNLSILYTSHNMREIEVMCSRVIFLHRGRIIADASPEHLLERFGHETMEEVFIAFSRNHHQLTR